MLRRHILAVGLATTLCASSGQATDWPQFRGPNASAISTEKDLPVEWAKDKNIAWKVQLPGYGWSCPVVWGDKVFVTTAVSDKQKKPGGFGMGMGGPGGGPGGGGFPKGGFNPKPPDDVFKWQVYCLNAADGKTIWSQTARETKPTIPTQASNTYASETPATDGQRVYAYFGAHGVYCFDMTGNEIWKKDLGTYPMALGFGTASSPALTDGRLFIQCDNEKESFLIALDAKSGKEIWKTPRSERTGWRSPIVWKTKDRTEVVCIGPQRARSYDAATGKQVWQLGGVNGQPKASAVASDELLVVGTGGGPGGGFGMGGFGPKGGAPGGPKGGGGFGGGSKPLFAIKPGASGDITLKDGEKSNEAVAWHQSQGGPSTASPLLYDGYIYILEERGGFLACYDAKTGKQAYKERLPGARGFTSSPWAYDGKVFCLDDNATTYVVEAGPTFKAIGKNTLEGMCWSSPAVAGGAVFLRTVDHLYCIRNAAR